MPSSRSNLSTTLHAIKSNPSFFIYIFIFVLTCYYLHRKRKLKLKVINDKLKSSVDTTQKVYFNYSNLGCGDDSVNKLLPNVDTSQLDCANNERKQQVDYDKPLMQYRDNSDATYDDATCNNLDDDIIEDKDILAKGDVETCIPTVKTIKKQQIGYDIFESTLKNLENFNNNNNNSTFYASTPLASKLDTHNATSNVVNENFSKNFQSNCATSDSNSVKPVDSQLSFDTQAYTRKFKNHLICQQTYQNGRFTPNYSSFKSNSNSNEHMYYQNQFERDYTKVKFLTNHYFFKSQHNLNSNRFFKQPKHQQQQAILNNQHGLFQQKPLFQSLNKTPFTRHAHNSNLDSIMKIRMQQNRNRLGLQ